MAKSNPENNYRREPFQKYEASKSSKSEDIRITYQSYDEALTSRKSERSKLRLPKNSLALRAVPKHMLDAATEHEDRYKQLEIENEVKMKITISRCRQTDNQSKYNSIVISVDS